MAFPPKFSGLSYPPEAGSHTHTIELFLDYVCPFSAKMFRTLSNGIFDLANSKYQGKVRFIFRPQIQSWHPQSTLVHEAGAAVLRLDPGKFYEFSKVLFEKQDDYFDINVVHETRNDTYKRLCELAKGIGIDPAKMFELLKVGDKPDKDGGKNIGNKVTDDIKYMVKSNRLTGVHVTPSVLFNGTPENSISSSFTSDQWKDWLEKNMV